MVEFNRKRIGLFLLGGEDWLGGVYYIHNIIRSFTYLPDSMQPNIVLFYNKKSASFADIVNYKRLEIVNYPPAGKIVTTYLKSIFTGRNYFVGNIINKYQLDGLFPLYDYVGKINTRKNCKIVSWYPDLQHKFYPQYFSFISRFLRNLRIHKMINHATDIVVSSKDMLDKFNKFYELPSKLKMQVVRFAAVNNNFDLISPSILIQKYSITRSYFIVSNQFYEHKNHWVLLKAIKRLKDYNMSPLILLTGKMEDYRNPNHVKRLLDYIKKNQLQSNIELLGIIPRSDQLSLMKHSLALIQPSKFEGWSTSIEDAKSLGTQVVCSNISVHKEQMEENAFYFSSDDERELAKIMYNLMNKSVLPKPVFTDYELNIYKFGISFSSLFN